jgi:hypothetical protein
MSSEASSLLSSANNAHLGESLDTALKTIVEVPSKYFKFECLVRNDKTVVLHLKGLTPRMRNKRDMDYLAKWFRDRVGGFKSYYADFIGEINRNDNKGAVKLNSIDIFISEYAPAMMHDESFIHRHFSNLAIRLIEELNCKH